MKKRALGFTLIDVLVSVTILFIVIVVIYDFFMNTNKFLHNQDENIEVSLQAKRLQEDIKQWFQMADQKSIECFPYSKRVEMNVYEYDLAQNIFLKYRIVLQYDGVQKKISIHKYDKAGREVSSSIYLEKKVEYFSVIENGNLVLITYEIKFSPKKVQKYEITYYRRTD